MGSGRWWREMLSRLTECSQGPLSWKLNYPEYEGVCGGVCGGDGGVVLNAQFKVYIDYSSIAPFFNS